MIGILKPGDYGLRNEEAFVFLGITFLVLLVEQETGLPDTTLDDPLQLLSLFNVMAYNERFNAATRMDEHVAAPAPVKRVDDATPVHVEVALRALRREVVEDGGGHEPEGRIVPLAETPRRRYRGLGQGRPRVGGRDGAGGRVGEREVAALDVGDQVERLDGGLHPRGGLLARRGVVGWAEEGKCLCVDGGLYRGHGVL